MPAGLDDIMQRASDALAHMDYLACEALCLEALHEARRRGDWPYYARILLPLQEARRQKRMIAAEGAIRLGTADLARPEPAWLASMPAGGCVLLSPPHTPDDAIALAQAANEKRMCIELLLAERAGDAQTWTLRSFQGPLVRCDVPAPPHEWRERWLDPAAARRGDVTVADWFLDAAESLGDVALAKVDLALPPAERLARLEAMLPVVQDHELLHQRLGDAARAMR